MRTLCAMVFMVGYMSSFSFAQTILRDVPMVLQSHSGDRMLMSFHDGTEYWVDVNRLASHLGFETVDADSMSVTLRDAIRVITFDGAEGTISVNQDPIMQSFRPQKGVYGELLVSMSDLSQAFGADMEWDPSALTLRLSTNPVLFTPDANPSSLTAPAELLFPRERTLLGGMHIFYDINHRWTSGDGSILSASARLSSAVAGGVVRANLSRSRPSGSYSIEMSHTWLTKASLSYAKGNDRPSILITNQPLAGRRIFGERYHTGMTIPHAIVKGRAGGNQADQVQADGEGRYALNLPIYYGTTRTSLDIHPIGHSPLPPRYYHEITPHTSLQQGGLEYNVDWGSRLNSSVAYGLTDMVTVRSQASTSPLQIQAGSTLRALRSLYVDVDVDVQDFSAAATVHQWIHQGEWEVNYRRYPDRSQALFGYGALRLQEVSFATRFSHRTSPYRSVTQISPSVDWHTSRGFSARLRSQITLSTTQDVSLHPHLSWGRRLGKVQARLAGGAELSREGLSSVNSTLRLSRHGWDAALIAERDVIYNLTTLSASLQFNTDYAWLGAESRYRAGQISLMQRARGTVGIDRGITFTALSSENALARFRVFVDTNFNGSLDDSETLLYTPEIHVNSFIITRRVSGELYTHDLSPNERYTVTITPESIENPLLYPITGYRFAFIAQAGRTRTLDVALQPLPLMQGRIEGWHAANEILRVSVVGAGLSHDLEVYRDGGFFALLPPGDYVFTVVNQITKEFVASRTARFAEGVGDIIINIPSGADE